MADIFRLLSRSTTFSKGAASAAPKPTAPAAPVVADPKTKKRKTVAIPKELDFFNVGEKEKKADSGLKKRKRDEESDSEMDVDSESDEEEGGVEEDETGEVLSEEEVRKVMREHKLKITVLHTPATVEKKKKKKGKKPGAEEEVGEKKKKKMDVVMVPPLTNFNMLRAAKHGYGLSKRVYRNIIAQGYSEPTEVQMGSLPLLMKKDLELPGHRTQEVDLLTCAPTGSGKTLAYVVPLLDSMLRERKSNPVRGVKAVILAPTKELAGQIVNEVKKLAVGTGVRVALMKKGMVPVSAGVADGEEEKKGERKEAGRKGEIKSDILVSTPLLLLHAIENSPDGEMAGIRKLVLDEADVLLDELFREQTLGIWRALRKRSKGTLRTSLWSATISSGTEEIAKTMILSSSSSSASSSSPAASTTADNKADKKKKKTSEDTDETAWKEPTIIRLIVGIKDTSLPTISQTLLYTATEPGKLLALRQLFTTSFHPPALIFVQSIPRAQALYNEILYDLPTPGKIAVLHASLTDTAREEVMDRFRRGDVWVLITTDLLARGVDFRGVRLVVNYDIPTTVAAYIHRVGRTGRAGREGGEAVTYYTKEDVGYVKGIANVISSSEKLRGEKPGEGIQKWLLDALPKTSRREKKKLKLHGVKARSVKLEGREAAKARISTKSGYERQKEDRRKGAREASKKRKEEEGEKSDAESDGGEEFTGFE
ncbi:RNA-dependent ATPase rok1 [Rhizina undulata]